MKKKKNGFTLVELLGVIIILSLLVAITTPFILKALDAGKNSSYEIFLDNIVTASKMYYEECVYGTIYDSRGRVKTCYLENSKYITVTLEELADAGFLTKSGDTIKNPKTDTDIKDCNIYIFIYKEDNGKIIYRVDGADPGDCPQGNLGETS